jgi:TetR/AcrR family fatty acid metabolism transcriptional regulator
MAPRYAEDKRKQAKSAARQRLLDAAVREIARAGYAKANVNTISRAAGFAKGTIYNYFRSKKDLMLTILSEIGAAHCTFITDQVCQVDDVVVRMERFFEAGFTFVAENPRQGQVLITTLHGANAEFKEHLHQVYQPLFRLVSEEILVPGMAQGVFRQTDLANTSVMIMTFYLGVGSIIDEKGKPYLDPKDVAAFVLRALGAEPAAGCE